MELNIKADLAEKLVGGNEEVKSRVIDLLYQQELTKRTDACVKVLALIDDTAKEYANLAKPDHQTFNENGSESTKAFTKERVDQLLQKLRDKKAKLEGALQAALEKNDFSKVLDAIK